ncbi:hypothetical protein C7212DRAFT_359635 [Tuber magnatum]|uniref:Uncharacterized protein n=1 Tax=Tuber magnatum TaxID=42249 RepID=A0A317SJ80_9PEZI|nr:hypothetical protein C7212DRAFT_359635 [Tuber magnatum]
MSIFLWLLFLPAVLCQLSSGSLQKFPNALALGNSFDPIIAAYWTGLPHHRRTPFSVSPDGKSAYLAYLSSTYSSVFIQQVDPSTFAAVGKPVEISGAREASGLVARNDGFAVLVNIDNSQTEHPISTIVRYKGGSKAWTRPVNGPGVHESQGLSSSPDMNGDLVYSEASGLYAAYFVVTAYTGDAKGHFGDSIQYVDDSGDIKTISGASSTFGCSHNTGIALEAADTPPFASVCAEDHGSIWLNTKTQYMSGVKIANENTTNGVSGEPMGGMSGSYSCLALFPGSSTYIFAWQSRGAVKLIQDDWMGAGYTQCSPRWLNHNVAISMMKDKSTLQGPEAISQVGAASGDDQVTWITKSETTDHQNVRVAALDSANAIVTWEELSNPHCQPVPLSCTGTFSGTFFQQVNSQGGKVGEAISAKDVFVSGDMQRIEGKGLCWPYVSMEWDLSGPKDKGTPVSFMSFACIGGGSGGGGGTPASPAIRASTTTTTTTQKPTVTPPETVPPSTLPSDTATETSAPPTMGPAGTPTSDTPSTIVTRTRSRTTRSSRSPPEETPTSDPSNSPAPCDAQNECPEGFRCFAFQGGHSSCVPAAWGP